MKNLLFSVQMVDTFTKFISRGYYSDDNIQDLMIKSIIDKINDNNIHFDDSKLMKNESLGLWLVSFDEYFNKYYSKKRIAKQKYWENVYNKNIRDGKVIKWTPESMMKNFKVDTAILEKDNCIQICIHILKNKSIIDTKNRLSHLFLKICSYVFKDEMIFETNRFKTFIFDDVSNVYFLNLKKTIDLCMNNYNKKEVEK